jgi:hypothetical protein
MRSSDYKIELNMKSFLCFTVIIFGISGCGTSSEVGTVWFGTGIDKSWGSGGEIWSHETTYTQQKVVQVANEFCERNNLPRATVTSVSTPKTKTSEYYIFKFQCNVKITPTSPADQYMNQSTKPSNQAQQSSSVNSRSIPLDEAKDKCADLGFKTNTEEFGKCVLQLTK